MVDIVGVVTIVAVVMLMSLIFIPCVVWLVMAAITWMGEGW